MGDDKGDGGFSRQCQGSVNNTSSAVLGLLLHYHVNQTMSQFVKGEGKCMRVMVLGGPEGPKGEGNGDAGEWSRFRRGRCPMRTSASKRMRRK